MTKLPAKDGDDCQVQASLSAIGVSEPVRPAQQAGWGLRGKTEMLRLLCRRRRNGLGLPKIGELNLTAVERKIAFQDDIQSGTAR